MVSFCPYYIDNSRVKRSRRRAIVDEVIFGGRCLDHEENIDEEEDLEEEDEGPACCC